MYKFIFAFLVLALAGHAQDLARMHEIVAKDDRFMGTVLIAKAGTVVFQESVGWANAEWQVKNTATTKFRLGSITKQFTAASILLLAERNQLKLEDPISKYIPGLPETWKSITIFQLLSHTSGIPNYTEFPDYLTWRLSPTQPAKILGYIRDKPLNFTPGSDYHYSNSGYVLLGWIVALVSGEDYATFLHQNIFEPLGMNDSGFDSATEIIAHRASGYARNSNRLVNAPYVDMSIDGGAGGLYSTAPDLLHWVEGLFGGKLLSAASLEKMTKPGKGNYGLGLGIVQVGGRKVIQHGGAVEGFVTHLSYYPESKIIIVVLGNVPGKAAELSTQLAAVELGESVTLPSEREAIDLPVASLRHFTGVYQFSSGSKNTVRLVDGQLMIQLTGQRAFRLFAESEDKFFMKIIDAQIEFFSDQAGKVTHLVMYQSGHETKATRTGDVVEPKVLPPATLEAYVGRYQITPNLNIAITLEGSQLMAQASGQNKNPLFFETETTFFTLAARDVQGEFVKDATGTVTGLIIRQSGRELKAQRMPEPTDKSTPSQ